LKLRDAFKELYRLKVGSAFLREARELEELLLFTVFAEYFGFSAPYKLLLGELYPELLEEFHRWHKRAGFPTSPLDHLKCC